MARNLDLERPVIHFSRGAHLFQIFRAPSDAGAVYLGFFDGRPSVAAGDRHTVTRMLLRRHASPQHQRHLTTGEQSPPLSGYFP